MNPQTPNASVDRRTFVKAVSAAGVALALGPGGAVAEVTGGPGRKRYAIVGVGSRSSMYQSAIQKNYKERAELVAVCDTNPGRLALAQRTSVTNGAPEPKAYAAGDFGKMLAETKPDYVIVTTVDCFHHEYIVRTL